MPKAPDSVPSPPPPFSRLLTRDQVIETLVSEIEATSLTQVAAEYGLSPQQLSDIRHGRAALSERVREKIQYRLWEFYEKLERK